MVDINEVYKSNSNNIKAEDIGDNMWTMTIKSADVEELKNKEGQVDHKIVLTFHEWDKSLPLNITNARAVAGLYGGNTDAWVGKQIMLFTAMVDFQGRPTLGIRVRAPQPTQPRMPGQTQPMPNSPQRPLDYQAASGGNPVYSERNPPPPTSNDYGGL